MNSLVCCRPVYLPLNLIGKRTSHKEFNVFYAEFITELESGIHGKKSSGTIQNYRATYRKLQKYQEAYGTLSWEGINHMFYKWYHQFLLDNNSGSAAFGNHIKRLKRVMREAYARGVHANDYFKDPNFRAIQPVTTGKIFLTTEEIKKIEEIDLKNHASPRFRARSILNPVLSDYALGG